MSYPGAVAADAPDAGVAAHYGEPSREQRRLEDGKGFVDLSHRGVIRLTGPDRLALLHALTTQSVEQLPPHQGTTTLVLSPHGHIEHAIYGVDDGESFWAHVEPGTAAEAAKFFDSMRFLMQVEVFDVTDEFAIVWEPRPDGPAENDVVVRKGADSLGGRELFVPRDSFLSYGKNHPDEHPPARMERLSGGTWGAQPPAGIWAYEAKRIEARVPRLGLETDHKTIPNEVGWLDTAVHLEKGCYRGQETVARVHNLGRPPRRLVFLHLDGSAETLPPHGASVLNGSREVGFVTSSARHHELGPIALALVKRNVPVDAPLTAGGVDANQEIVVDPEVGLHFKAAR